MTLEEALHLAIKACRYTAEDYAERANYEASIGDDNEETQRAADRYSEAEDVLRRTRLSTNDDVFMVRVKP